MRRCAYCGNAAPPTKEHLWPDCILKRRTGKRRYSSNAAPGRFLGPANLQIKDVCAKCNNESLSALDTYSCIFYDHYVTDTVEAGESLKIQVDFDLLLRWVLKMLYNNSRAAPAGQKYVPVFARYADYIRDGGSPPFDVMLFLQVVIPWREDGQELLPSYLECAHFGIPGFDERLADAFTLALDALRFIPVILKRHSASARQKIEADIRTLPATSGAVRIRRAKQVISVPASDIDARYAIGPGLMNDFEKWKALLDERNPGSV